MSCEVKCVKQVFEEGDFVVELIVDSAVGEDVKTDLVVGINVAQIN
jgi:hypothetical protein